MRHVIVLVLAAAAAGCALTSTEQLAQDTFRLKAYTAAACGASGSEKYALMQAAKETIRRGYDRFIIVDAQIIPTAGSVPMMVQGVVISGPRIESNSKDLVVKVMRDSDPGAGKALSARATLGPDWKGIVAKPELTCLD